MVERMKNNDGILSGCDEIVDKFFGVAEGGKAKRYRTKTTFLCPDLEKRTDDARKLLRFLDERIEKNWKARKRCEAPSKENWRWEARPKYALDRKGLEVKLEREIVKAMSEESQGDLPCWVNAVPTASGLYDSVHDRVRNVDLAYSPGPKECTLFELKWDADTPVFAAIEVLYRGLLAVFTRVHLREKPELVQPRPMLTCDNLHLRVLAPFLYYDKYYDNRRVDKRRVNLTWLEKKLCLGLEEYSQTKAGAAPKMDFGFEMFPEEFKESGMNSADHIRNALKDRLPAYGKHAAGDGPR